MKKLLLLISLPVIANAFGFGGGDPLLDRSRDEKVGGGFGHHRSAIVDKTTKSSSVSNGSIDTSKTSTVVDKNNGKSYSVDSNSMVNKNGVNKTTTYTNAQTGKSYSVDNDKQTNGVDNQTITNNQNGQTRTLNNNYSNNQPQPIIVNENNTGEYIIPVVAGVGAGAAIVSAAGNNSNSHSESAIQQFESRNYTESHN